MNMYAKIDYCKKLPPLYRRESYPLIVKASDLVSSLDVQEFSLGKYVVKWAREGGSRATTTTFELSPLKVNLPTEEAFRAFLPS